MRAVSYDRQGPASEVLQFGELPDPEPGPGEVRVRLRFSGVNPGDTKKRAGYFGSAMPYARVIPHSDGSGVIDAVGEGVAQDRRGQRVWVYNGQSYRPYGTAAQFTVVPDISGDAARRGRRPAGSVPGDPRDHRPPGRVRRRCGSRPDRARARCSRRGLLARGPARALGRRHRDQHRAPYGRSRARPRLRERAVALDVADPVSAISDQAPDGVDRIVEVAFSDNIDLDSRVAANGAVIAAYATRDPRPGSISGRCCSTT